jgi:hypothetical protein
MLYNVDKCAALGKHGGCKIICLYKVLKMTKNILIYDKMWYLKLKKRVLLEKRPVCIGCG